MICDVCCRERPFPPPFGEARRPCCGASGPGRARTARRLGAVTESLNEMVSQPSFSAAASRPKGVANPLYSNSNDALLEKRSLPPLTTQYLSCQTLAPMHSEREGGAGEGGERQGKGG